MSETGVVKACVACGKNLSGQKRMKDSQGRYWCMECGAEDQRKKMASGVTSANICNGCGDTFPVHELSVWGSKRLCPKCSPSSKGPGMLATVTGLLKGGGGGGQTDRTKIIIMAIVMVILMAIAFYLNFG
jgi:hypothetical protein